MARPIANHESLKTPMPTPQRGREPWQLSFPVNFYLVFFVSEGNAVGYTTILLKQVTPCTIFKFCLQRYEEFPNNASNKTKNTKTFGGLKLKHYLCNRKKYINC